MEIEDDIPFDAPRYLSESGVHEFLNISTGLGSELRVFVPFKGEANLVLDEEQNNQFTSRNLDQTGYLDGIFELFNWTQQHQIMDSRNEVELFLRESVAIVGLTLNQKQLLGDKAAVEFSLNATTLNGMLDLKIECFHLVRDILEYCSLRSIPIVEKNLINRSMSREDVMQTLSSNNPEKDSLKPGVDPRERKTMLQLIGLMAELLADQDTYSLPIDQPHKAAEILVREAKALGGDIGGRETIAKKLTDAAVFRKSSNSN
jgi:hypothetical protein